MRIYLTNLRRKAQKTETRKSKSICAPKVLPVKIKP